MGRAIEAFREKDRKRKDRETTLAALPEIDINMGSGWVSGGVSVLPGIQFNYGNGCVDLETDIVDKINLLLKRQEKLIKAVKKLAAFASPVLASGKLFTELHLGDSNEEERQHPLLDCDGELGRGSDPCSNHAPDR